MSTIAVLGLGAMGSRMALSLLDAGHAVTVWNRDPARSEVLGGKGALVASSPRAAASGADFVISMVRDDDASRHVWADPVSGALGGMSASAVAIESSTLTLGWVSELAALASAKGIAFLDAPVAGSRPQAEAKQLIYFVGGSDADVGRAEPILKAMGSAVHHAGPTGAGAAVKLAVNALFGIQVAAMAELIGLLRASGIDLARAIEIMGATPVMSPGAKGAAASMLAGAFTPMFPTDLVEKDFGYAEAAAEQVKAATPMTSAARKVFRSAIQSGHGSDHLTSVVRLYTK
jgi:3-hydroxyisobutyrate dehydrogenase